MTVPYSLAYHPTDMEKAKEAAFAALQAEDPFAENEAAFNAWFDRFVPVLQTENEDIRKIYYYRFYLIYRATYRPVEVIPDHRYKKHCFYESPTGKWYGTFVDLPVPYQIAESRWMRDPVLGREHMETWTMEGERHSTYIHFTPFSAMQFYRLHPDRAWLAKNYEGFVREVVTNIDVEHPERLRVTNGSWPTGAEYQPSFYQYTPNEPWDWRYDEQGAREAGFPRKQLYRLDTLCYDVLSLQGLSDMARELNKEEDAKRFSRAAEEIRRGVLAMWDEDKQFFFDRDKDTGKLCDEAPCYDGFAPFLCGIADAGHFGAFRLLDAEEEGFGGDFSYTTVARSNPMYWYDNCLTGPTAASLDAPKTYGCCWNGPVWPYANSLIANAMGSAAEADTALRRQWLCFFDSYTELHFIGGDRSVPLICEHYRPDDGASFSSANDYFHSSWLDPFMRYWAGIDADGETVSFAPYTACDFTLSGVVIRGKEYTFKQERGETSVTETEER